MWNYCSNRKVLYTVKVSGFRKVTGKYCFFTVMILTAARCASIATTVVVLPQSVIKNITITATATQVKVYTLALISNQRSTKLNKQQNIQMIYEVTE